MTEELLRKFAELRAQRLALNGAQKWVYTDRVIQLWLAGAQSETALSQAAKDYAHAN